MDNELSRVIDSFSHDDKDSCSFNLWFEQALRVGWNSRHELPPPTKEMLESESCRLLLAACSIGAGSFTGLFEEAAKRPNRVTLARVAAVNPDDPSFFAFNKKTRRMLIYACGCYVE